MCSSKNILPLLTGCLLLNFCACRKNNCEVYRRYAVVKPMVVYPQSERIRLGDTLTAVIHVPFNNRDTLNQRPVDISLADFTPFKVDFVLYNKTASQVLIEGADQFNIIQQKGSGIPFNNVAYRYRFAKEDQVFIFEVKIIPLKKGLVNLVNYRAEGYVRGNCDKVDLIPVNANRPDNHHLYRQFGRFLDSTHFYIPPNHYFIWVE